MIEFKEPYDEASDICRAFLCMVGLVESTAFKLCGDVCRASILALRDVKK